ncbi:MAG: hypothetical protein R6W88_07235 [Desulfobacterales bacterium]
MIYIGYFSFDELGAENEARHGYFSCVAEAEDVDEAVNKFKYLIMSLNSRNESNNMFRNIAAVYIEDIIEIQHIPEKAFVTRIQSSSGEFPKSVTKSLPHGIEPGVNAYGWIPDVEKTESNENQEEYKTSKPFIRF